MKAPKGWKIESLSWAVASLESGISEGGEDRVAAPHEAAVLKVSAVTSGRFLPNLYKVLNSDEIGRTRISVKGDSILVNRANGSAALVGISVYVPTAYPNRFLPDKIWQITARADRSTGRFLGLLTSMPRFRDEVLNQSSGGTGMRNIGSGRYLEIETLFPPLPEQQKIADILGAWDEALEKLDALIAAKDRRKEAFMQQLLTGKRRLPGFRKPWPQTTFGQFLTESRIEGSDGLTAKKITVKLYGRGVFAKQARMVGSFNTKYFIRRSGQLIYSKLDFLNGAFGIIPPQLDGYESTLDLPSFDVNPSADARWLLSHLVRPEFYEKQVGAAAGGRIARRVNPPEFLKLRLKATRGRRATRHRRRPLHRRRRTSPPPPATHRSRPTKTRPHAETFNRAHSRPHLIPCPLPFSRPSNSARFSPNFAASATWPAVVSSQCIESHA